MEQKQNKEQLAEMLIKFYNMQAGTSLKAKNEKTQERMLEVLTVFDESVVDTKNFIRCWVSNNPEKSREERPLTSLIEGAYDSKASEKIEVVTETPKVTENQIQYSMGMLEQAVVQLISNMNSEKIEQNVMSSVEEKVKQFIKDEYGTIERKITTIVDGKKAEMKGIQHDKFETVLKFVANDEPVYLSGPAGSGKNVICKQVAEALGLKFYFTNSVTQEYKLTGFTDANGTYHATQFYKAFTEGGVFFLDEMDASIPEVLVILNAAIANRYFDFPAPIGYVEAHPDFRVIAAGNTTGHGANYEYVGRSQLDGASLDRFAFVSIDYSEAIEDNIAQGDKELVKFCDRFRKSANKQGVNIIVSYRAISRLAKMVQVLSIEEALETCLLKGLEKDDLNIIANGMNDSSKYYDSLRKIIERM